MLVPTLVRLALFVMNVTETVILMLTVQEILSASREMVMKLFQVVVTEVLLVGITATMMVLLPVSWSISVLILVLLALLVLNAMEIVTQTQIVHITLNASREMVMK